MVNEERSTGEIYKSGKRYGGYFTGPALDIDFVNEGTIFKGNNVQLALGQISDMFKKDGTCSGTIEHIAVGINPDTSNLALMIKWKSNDDNEPRTSYIDFTSTKVN